MTFCARALEPVDVLRILWKILWLVARPTCMNTVISLNKYHSNKKKLPHLVRCRKTVSRASTVKYSSGFDVRLFVSNQITNACVWHIILYTTHYHDNANEISRSRKREQAPLRCKNAHACGLFRVVLCACCRHVALRWWVVYSFLLDIVSIEYHTVSLFLNYQMFDVKFWQGIRIIQHRGCHWSNSIFFSVKLAVSSCPSLGWYGQVWNG